MSSCIWEYGEETAAPKELRDESSAHSICIDTHVLFKYETVSLYPRSFKYSNEFANTLYNSTI
jgi:hypothetical protein